MKPFQLFRPITANLLLLSAAAFCPPAEARTGRYLVVAAPDFATSTPLGQLTAARTAAGLEVAVYAVPVGTTREELRAYIQAWYVPGQPAYLAIIGDSTGVSPVTATTIPNWIGLAFHAAPTDLPYACLDAGDDWYPELSIGRIPVDTVAELQAVVDKTLAVESGTYPDPSYAQRASFCATSDPNAGADAIHDWVIASLAEPAGFTATRIYASLGGGTADISNALNAGSLFTAYLGHSNSTAWWDPPFGIADVQALTNLGHYGLILAFSCGTARFDATYGEGLGEYFLREPHKGAAAYISATGLVYSGPSSEWESVRRLEKYFFQAVFTNAIWEAGPAWRAALYMLLDDPDYGPAHPHTRDYFESFALLGDPALLFPHLAPATGDFDEDGDVDLADLSVFQTCFGGAASGVCAAGDLVDDDLIDAADLPPLAAELTGPR